MNDAPPPIPLPLSAAASTQTVGEPADEDRARVFPCEACGADLRFNVGEQALKCPYCGHVKPLEFDASAEVSEQDFYAMLDRVRERRMRDRPDARGLSEVHCEACGATVRFQGTLTSKECAYCGVPLQLDGVHDAKDRVPVDGVLPFLVDRDRARANLSKWVRSRWFAPNDFTSRGVEGRFNGVYLPYWTYDTLTGTHYVGERGEHYWTTVGHGKNKRRVRRTRWYPASGSFRRFFDDVLIVAATGLPNKYVVALEPWPLRRCVPFNPEMLAGFLARTYDVELDRGLAQAKDLIAQAIEADVRRRIGGDTQRIHSINTNLGAVTYKHLLLPVWMLTYRYREKPYRVVINATTGEVQGERPYSWIKILLAVVAGAIVAAAIYFLTQQ